MYPSKKDVRYGIFVKRFEEAIEEDFGVKRIVLTKRKNSVSKTIGYFVLYLKVLSLMFRCKSKDIVYVHFPLYFSLVLLPLAWARVPLVINFHGSDATFGSPLKKMFKWFLGPVIKISHKIVVPSSYYKEKIMGIFNVGETEKIFVYPSGGISAQLFRPHPNQQQEEFVYGYVSNFIEKKGWRIFLEALSTISKEYGPNKIKGIMVGDGPDKRQVVKTIKDLRINVELIGNVPQDKLAGIYSRFNAFIFPTYREEESLGLVGIEAMMCGIPVIASKVGGPLGYVEEGYNGFLFEKRNCGELVLKMGKFQKLTNKELDKMKKNCISTAGKYESTLVNEGLIRMLKSINYRE